MTRLRLILVLATFAAYAPATRSGFVSDDHHVIEHGRLIGSLANIPQLFAHNAMWNSDGGVFAKAAAVDTYRPLTMTTFFLERAIFGLQPGPYHVVSVLIHLANVLLLFALGGRLGLSREAAAAGALLFAVHPAICEAVHWVNGRSDPLCLLFFLGALILWMRAPPDRVGLPRGSLIAVLVLGACLCKETAFLLVPPLLLLAFHRGLRGRAFLVAFFPFALGLGAGALLRLAALDRAAVSGGADHLLYAAARAPLVWRDGLLSFLSVESALRPSLYEHYASLTPIGLALALAMLLALVAASIVLWRRGNILLPWATATFLIVLAPIALLTYAEGWSGWGRYLYPALWLHCLAAGSMLVDWLLPRMTPRLRVAWGAAGIVVLLGAAVQTFVAAGTWRNDRTFALAQIADAPTASPGYAALALADNNAGNHLEALASIDMALEIAPSEPRFLARKALTLSLLGRHPEAAATARRALVRDPRHRMARYVLALAFLNEGRQNDAAETLMSLLADDPGGASAWDTLQQAWTRFGRGSPFRARIRALADDRAGSAMASKLRPLFVAEEAHPE